MSALYTDYDGKWHSEYIAKARRMTTAELLYVIKDCEAAMAALPENPKWEQYADERPVLPHGVEPPEGIAETPRGVRWD